MPDFSSNVFFPPWPQQLIQKWGMELKPFHWEPIQKLGADVMKEVLFTGVAMLIGWNLSACSHKGKTFPEKHSGNRTKLERERCPRTLSVHWYPSKHEAMDFLFVYLLLAMLGLPCCVGFSLLVISCDLHCGPQLSSCGGFSCCRPWALGHAGFRSCGTWV